MKNKNRVQDFHIGLIREVCDYMDSNDLAEVEFTTKIQIALLKGDNVLVAYVKGLNAVGDLYLDDFSIICIRECSIYNTATILDELENKKYSITEMETTPHK